MKKISGEKGIISLFTIFLMLLLLVFTLIIFSVIENMEKSENSKKMELEEIYSEDFSKVKKYVYANNDDVIPIYNIREFNNVGTGNFIQIKNKIYQCNRNKQYLLRENIIVDIEEDLEHVEIGFNDYKFYSPSFNIDKNIYDIYYFYQNYYWKVLAYQKFSKNDKNKNIVEDGTYLENKFSIINNFKYENNTNNFMMLWSSKDGKLDNVRINEQNAIPNKIEDILVFNEGKNEINTIDGEFFIFINIGNTIKKM